MAYQSGCWIFGNVSLDTTSQCNGLAIFQAQTTRDVGELAACSPSVCLAGQTSCIRLENHFSMTISLVQSITLA